MEESRKRRELNALPLFSRVQNIVLYEEVTEMTLCCGYQSDVMRKELKNANCGHKLDLSVIHRINGGIGRLADQQENRNEMTRKMAKWQMETMN